MAHVTGAEAAQGASATNVGGPAAVAGALYALDQRTQRLVRLVIAQNAIQEAEFARGVGQLHDRIARLLHELSLEHGSDATTTAADYAAAALEARSLYPGEELELFLRDVSGSVRATSRALTKSTPFGA